MATTDELLVQLITSLVAEGCVPGDFEAECVRVIGKLRSARNREIRDMEAARLLPLGREIAAERLGVRPSPVYKMTHRYRRRLSTGKQQA